VNKLIGIVGDAAAVVGILVCVISGAARLVGTYGIAGVGASALFMFGIGIMVFACLAKLHLLTMRANGG